MVLRVRAGCGSALKFSPYISRKGAESRVRELSADLRERNERTSPGPRQEEPHTSSGT